MHQFAVVTPTVSSSLSISYYFLNSFSFILMICWHFHFWPLTHSWQLFEWNINLIRTAPILTANNFRILTNNNKIGTLNEHLKHFEIDEVQNSCLEKKL